MYLFARPFLLILYTAVALLPTGFREEQLRNERVKAAYQANYSGVKELLRANGIPVQEPELYIRILKWEKLVEVWGKGRQQKEFRLLRQYPVCAVSGKLGPKRQKGDRQIPEGFYSLNRFHPVSKFHLSLGLNYPNRSDSLHCTANDPGGDIFLHGGCATIGCIPITNEKMEELYVLAVEAQHYGQQKIQVHLFPGRMDAANFSRLTISNANDPELLHFWESLQPAYTWFGQHHTLPPVLVLANGTYSCKQL